MWSCIEGLDARNMMLQSEFNLYIPCRIYGFFLFQTSLHVDDVIVLFYLHIYTYVLSLCAQDLLDWNVAHHV